MQKIQFEQAREIAQIENPNWINNLVDAAYQKLNDFMRRLNIV